jgi:hypothetical protein
MKGKGINRTDKIGYGYLCPFEENLGFKNENHDEQTRDEDTIKQTLTKT